LKSLALSHIRSGLAKCDIVEESFSIFASRYDEVRKLYIDQLAFVWMEDSTAEATRARVEEKIDGFAEGDYDHAAETLSALWEIATKDGDVKAPSTATPAATPVTSPENWAHVNKALIKSIRKGVFFDRKYWARHYKSGDAFKPVYFSSIIMNDKARQLDKIVKYLKDEDPLMRDLKGQVNVESDCDSIGPVVPKNVGVRTISKSFPCDYRTPSTLDTAEPQAGLRGGWGSLVLDTTGLQPERSLTFTGLTLASSEREPAPIPTVQAPSTPIPALGEEGLTSTINSYKNKKKGRKIPRPFRPELVTPPQNPVQEPITKFKNPAQEPITTFKYPAQEDTLDGWNTQETEEQIRAILVTGSFSAWKSLFFYRCTDEISFAPLKSQGVVSRANYIREKTVAVAPPPCSPKSIYVLADLLGIPLLREKAFEDFKKKVNSNTVVGEVFSWITAGQKEILEMECDLLVSSSQGPSTVALVKDSIRQASDGSSPHCAGALKLGLEKAFKSKKESTFVKLRCPYGNCAWYRNPVACSSIGPGAYYCQMCINQGWGSRHFQCAGCGYNRTSNYTSCQSCGKRFI